MSQMTDPIADLLTRIRNAFRSRKRRVDVPASNLKREIVKLLVDEGYLQDYLNIEDGKQGLIRIFLRYDRQGKPAITGLKRVSTPGLRHYVSVKELPRVRNGLGTAILSTPRGVISEKRARKENVGGEVLVYVW